jgi:predicted nucleic acid-binding protein
MSGGVVYLETSALLRALFGEEGGEQVRSRLASAERIVTSRLLQVEAERTLLRAVLDHPELERQLPDLERELRNVMSHLDVMEITREICEAAGRVAPRARLRSLDAIHLATFQRLRQLAPEAILLSFDQRLLAAL